MNALWSTHPLHKDLAKLNLNEMRSNWWHWQSRSWQCTSVVTTGMVPLKENESVPSSNKFRNSVRWLLKEPFPSDCPGVIQSYLIRTKYKTFYRLFWSPWAPDMISKESAVLSFLITRFDLNKNTQQTLRQWLQQTNARWWVCSHHFKCNHNCLLMAKVMLCTCTGLVLGCPQSGAC